MYRTAALLLWLFLLPVAAQSDDLEVRDPWIMEAPPGARVNAGYFGISNRGDSEAVLVGVDSERFGRVEIHRTVITDGIAGMARESAIAVAAGATVSFQPGGLHLMLMEATARPHAGETVPVSLVFASGSRLQVDFPVRRAGAAEGHGHGHGSH